MTGFAIALSTRFPRSKERGLIEACNGVQAERWPRDFPRSKERGLIEAG